MKLQIHFIVSFILALALFPFYGYYAILVFIGGFLVDADHFLYYLLRFKKFNLKKAYLYFEDVGKTRNLREYQRFFLVFHFSEIIVLLVILSFFHKIFFIILIGLLSHIILDIIYCYSLFKDLSRFSFMWYLNVNKQNKK
jgi:hypothetical protein